MGANFLYIAAIKDVSANDIALVGGKGANLGELTRAGLPVPKAFCVTTKAYALFLDHNRLHECIRSELEAADYNNVVDLAQRATRIRDRFIAGEIPAGVVEDIRRGYAGLESELGAGLSVSVRSSATAEDLPGTSFAGQQDTYLHIAGPERIIEHVRRCWASLWTDRAIAYRQRQGFRHEDVLLAVVVQEMFPSEVAGVMFTVNPVTSNPTETFINTSWGLGEAVVSGRVNPDQYIVDRKSLRIVEKTIHDKEVMTVRRSDGHGSEEVHVPDDKRTIETLTDAQIAELAAIGNRIADYYGYPQDIEWGFAAGRFALLQSREVTTADVDFAEGLEAFQDPEALADIANERWVWSRAYSDEVQTGPSSPYFYSQLQASMTILKHDMLEFTDAEEFLGYGPEDFKKIPFYRWYGARAYYNLAVERERIRRFIPPFARDDSALWPFPAGEREEIRDMPFDFQGFLKKMWDIHTKRPRVSLLESHRNLIQNVARWKEDEQAVWDKVDFETASARQFIDLQVNLRVETGFAENVCLPFTIYLFVLPAALKKLCAEWLDDTDGRIYAALVAGLSTKTSEENVAIWHLSQSIRKSQSLIEIASADAPLDVVLKALRDSPEAGEFNSLFVEFIKNYGHRGGAERDPVHPRYRHKPQNVLIPIRSMLKLDEQSSPEVVERNLAARMRETRESCQKKLRENPLDFTRPAFFDWFVDLVQQWMYYRDFERFYNDKSMSRPRDFLTALGRRFVARGLLKDVEDIFFLGKEEIVWADEGDLSAKDVDHRIRSRRRVYARYTGREPPKYLQGWRTFDDEILADDGRGLRGIAASSGVVSGRARVCRSLDEIGKVEKGDILVTVATDPGWTTVFSFIAGVVVETGGVVAHAVLISREYGLPCVANLLKACERIPDGAMITVDGTNGRVIIHDAA